MEGWKRGEGFCTILTVFHRSIHKNPRNLCNPRSSQGHLVLHIYFICVNVFPL